MKSDRNLDMDLESPLERYRSRWFFFAAVGMVEEMDELNRKWDGELGIFEVVHDKAVAEGDQGSY